jgi:membrane fusion protein (multidrug efflux system)
VGEKNYMISIKKYRRPFLIGFFVVLAIAAIGGVAALRHHSNSDDGAPKVTSLEFVANDLAYVQEHPLARTLAITGNLNAKSQASVKAKAALDVRSIEVREGDPVRAGQLLAQLDTADLQARLAEKISARDSARAQMELADKNRATNQALLEKKFISQNAFDSTEGTFKANRAVAEEADAEVELARIALRQATVTAPISGIIGKRSVKVGEKTSVDSPMFTVVDLDSLELEAMVPAAEVTQLTRGMPARIEVDGLAGQGFNAILDRVSPATEPGTRSVLVFLTVRNTDHVLKSGMFATGTVQLGASTRLPSLPLTAIHLDAGQPIVWTIESNVLTRRSVELGLRDESAGLVEIRRGPPASVPVLATRFDYLKEGVAASIKAPTPELAHQGPSSSS